MGIPMEPPAPSGRLTCNSRQMASVVASGITLLLLEIVVPDLCHYKTLGLSTKATDADIKQQFRRLAKEWHPDINKEPEAKQRFIEILVAYNALSDQVSRREYDKKREQNPSQNDTPKQGTPSSPSCDGQPSPSSSSTVFLPRSMATPIAILWLSFLTCFWPGVLLANWMANKRIRQGSSPFGYAKNFRAIQIIVGIVVFVFIVIALVDSLDYYFPN